MGVDWLGSDSSEKSEDQPSQEKELADTAVTILDNTNFLLLRHADTIRMYGRSQESNASTYLFIYLFYLGEIKIKASLKLKFNAQAFQGGP